MAIDFGSIESYNADRGFGFVGNTFTNSSRPVFFHISTIKRPGYYELAHKLQSGEKLDTVNLWYQSEKTKKGKQASYIWLSVDDIPQDFEQELSDLVEKLENTWKDLSSPKPSWLDLVTTELVGANRRNELSAERDNLESQRKAEEEEQRRQAVEEEQRRQAEEEQRKQAEEEQCRQAEALRDTEITRLARQHNLSPVEADELHRLLVDMRPLNFTRSKQLSAYIKRYKLGYKYPNIAGTVIMEDGGVRWRFEGGFPTHIYGIICRELKLDNQRTSAIVIGFDSHENQRKRGHSIYD